MKDEFVLYRKYRPQHFDDVFGQEHIIHVLENALSQHRIAHAYLFSGPRGSGKTSIARIFARAVNCAVLTRPENDSSKRASRRSNSEVGNKSEKTPPCNACDMCKEFILGQTLDLIEIDAASNRGIEEVRALREGALTLPSHSAYKVYIIDEMHMMTTPAFNAFLKILEEPPAHVIFIMATTEPEKIPETIISRTQHLRFHALPEPIVTKALAHVAKKEGLTIDNEAISLLSFLSEGSLRDALNLLLQAQGVSGKAITANTVRDIFGIPARELIEGLMDSICSKQSESAARAVSHIGQTSISHDIFLRQLIRNFRFLLLATLDPKFSEDMKGLIGSVEYDYIMGKKGALTSEELRTILATFLYTANVHYQSPYPSLPLELAVSKIMSVIGRTA
ncbi:MAG: DNA polymerase III subunit gamma/tau [bacterium]|nr:DNA polymerase III subunit gamma/tau [bacterium]